MKNTNKRKQWTKDEELLLQEMYPTATLEKLETTFNTTWKSIKDKAFKLGLVRENFKSYDESSIIKDYTINKLSAKVIAEKYRISTATLYSILKKSEVTRRNNKLNLDDATFKEEYTSMTTANMAKKYDVAYQQINTRAAELGLTKPQELTVRQPSVDVDAMIADYRSGMRMKDIALKYYGTENCGGVSTLFKSRGVVIDKKETKRKWLESLVNNYTAKN